MYSHLDRPKRVLWLCVTKIPPLRSFSSHFFFAKSRQCSSMLVPALFLHCTVRVRDEGANFALPFLTPWERSGCTACFCVQSYGDPLWPEGRNYWARWNNSSTRTRPEDGTTSAGRGHSAAGSGSGGLSREASSRR